MLRTPSIFSAISDLPVLLSPIVAIVTSTSLAELPSRCRFSIAVFLIKVSPWDARAMVGSLAPFAAGMWADLLARACPWDPLFHSHRAKLASAAWLLVFPLLMLAQWMVYSSGGVCSSLVRRGAEDISAYLALAFLFVCAFRL